MDVNSLVQTVAIYALPVLFAITLHEAAHGYVARHFGDMTAHAQGRISLNPIRHIDPIGTIVVPIVILLLTRSLVGGGLLFGWAKPVPVNYSALQSPRRTTMGLVAAAGPAANLAMLAFWAAVLRVGVNSPLAAMAEAGVIANLVIMAVNLLPILPLDGGRMVVAVLPRRAAINFSKLEPWGLPILFGVISLSYFGINILGLLLAPIMSVSMSVIGTLFQL